MKEFNQVRTISLEIIKITAGKTWVLSPKTYQKFAKTKFTYLTVIISEIHHSELFTKSLKPGCNNLSYRKGKKIDEYKNEHGNPAAVQKEKLSPD